MSECIYKSVQQAKNGTSVPVFLNGRTFFSSYNPERDVENFLTAHKETFSGAGFILIGGIGNGLHLEQLIQTYRNARIIAFEADETSLAFSHSLLSDDILAETRKSESRLIVTSIEHLRQVLLTEYIPALHGNFAFAAVRSWHDFLGEKSTAFMTLINGTISEISADYSVQAQFGKLWHRNILTNLSLFDSMKPEQHFNISCFSSNAKKAAITGAGPSLDNDIQKLIKNRSEYCIFATDTSYGTLKDAGITPDFAVTVDSQQISEKHFVGYDFTGTVLASDLTGNSSIISSAVSNNATILLFHNSHPLSLLTDSWLHDSKEFISPFPLIDTGAGTVLHAAADLAQKLGFFDLSFFGTDFSYRNGKPYTKGTYLEKLYYTDDFRTGNAETAYSRLMYRTPLISLDDGSSTTEVLIRYKKALETFLEQETVHSLKTQMNASANIPNSFKMSEFIPWYLEKLQKKDKKVLFSLLPLAAWYKKNFSDADIESVYAFAEQQTANVGRIQCLPQKN